VSLPSLRSQVASAVHLIVQVARHRDGRRRVVQIEEIIGLEGEAILTQPLFVFRPGEMGKDGVLQGTYEPTGAQPKFLAQAAYYGKQQAIMDTLKAG
jgi:pilus assembly protein CpaF